MRKAEEHRLKWKGGRTTSATAMGRPTGASADRLAGGPSFVVWAAGGASVPFESAGVDRPCLARFDSQHSANRWRRLPDLPEVLPDWRRPRRHGLRSPNRAAPRLESDRRAVGQRNRELDPDARRHFEVDRRGLRGLGLPLQLRL